MRRIELDEMKQIQMQILDRVDAFCKEHNINYWLDCGTLLGAVRHKGYIPWDDDIDIGMLRPDYDKFMESFNNENDIYKAYSVENNPKFLYPFIKILDTRTVLYEPDEKGVKSCVNIDLFVYDNAPDNGKLLKKQYKTRDKYQRLHNIRTRVYMSKSNKLKHFAKIMLYPFLLVFPKNYFVKKIVANSKKYASISTKHIGNFTSISKAFFEKKLVSSFVSLEFEDKRYEAPIGYDSWLKTFYGDYMKLPPEGKRVPHHQFKAYFEENQINE